MRMHARYEENLFTIAIRQKYVKFAANQNSAMKRYNDYRTSKRTVEVHDLSFLSDPAHHYGWFRRHYRHHKLRRALKKAELIIAHNPKVVTDLRRYYFIPKERVTMSPSDKA